MLTLLKTFLDIAILRKGPDALPAAWLVLYVAVALWLAGIIVMALIVPGLGIADLLPSIVGWASSMLLFALVIAVAGYSNRLPQSLAAIAGAGAVVLYAQVAAVAVLLPTAGAQMGNLAVQVLLLWAVFVKGYIVSATIGIRPLLGVAISFIVYIMRELVTYSISPAPV